MCEPIQCSSKGILIDLEVQAQVLVLSEAVAGATVLVQEAVKLPFAFELVVAHAQHVLEEVSCTLHAQGTSVR